MFGNFFSLFSKHWNNKKKRLLQLFSIQVAFMREFGFMHFFVFIWNSRISIPGRKKTFQKISQRTLYEASSVQKPSDWLLLGLLKHVRTITISVELLTCGAHLIISLLFCMNLSTAWRHPLLNGRPLQCATLPVQNLPRWLGPYVSFLSLRHKSFVTLIFLKGQELLGNWKLKLLKTNPWQCQWILIRLAGFNSIFFIILYWWRNAFT